MDFGAPEKLHQKLDPGKVVLEGREMQYKSEPDELIVQHTGVSL